MDQLPQDQSLQDQQVLAEADQVEVELLAKVALAAEGSLGEADVAKAKDDLVHASHKNEVFTVWPTKQ